MALTNFPFKPPISLEKAKQIVRQIPELSPEIDSNGVLREEYGIVYPLNRITNRYSEPQRMTCKRKGFDSSPADVFLADEASYSTLVKEADGNPQKLAEIRKSIFKLANECSLFPISRVVYLLHHLFGKDLRTIRWLDMSAGWGDRLIAAISLQIAKYQGVDPNEAMKPAYDRIIGELADGNPNYQVAIAPFEDFDVGDELYDIAFTSPPFFDYELYSSEEGQSTTRYRTEEEWTTGFLIPYAQKALQSLKEGGYLVLYIEQHDDSYVSKLIETIGTPEETLFMGYSDAETKRPFYIWKKPSTPTPAPAASGAGVDEPIPASPPMPPPRRDAPAPAPAPATSGVGAEAPLSILPETSTSTEKPFGVILLRAFGDFPDTGGFSLMTSGFLTDGISIRGSTISHVTEEKVRSMLGTHTLEDEEETRIRKIQGINDLDVTDHRLAMEDIVRILPKASHCLIEIATLPAENVERIARILLKSNKRVILLRCVRKEEPVFTSLQQRFYPKTRAEYTRLRTHLGNVKAYLEDIGGRPRDLEYSSKDKTVRIGNRVGFLYTSPEIITRKGQRVLSRPNTLIGDYVREYPSGGALRKISLEGVPSTTPYATEIILPEDWKSGASQSLIVEPFRVQMGGRKDGISITSHTEIIQMNQEGKGVPFIPLSWHRGDMRTIQRHHEPLSVQMKVL